MATIRVMSWNIQNLGASKFMKSTSKPIEKQPDGVSFMVNYIAAAVEEHEVDVIGIMEIVGEIGLDFSKELAKKLAGTWKACVSSKQQSARAEQVIWLWKESATLQLWTPPPNTSSPSKFLMNIVDDDSMQYFFDSLKANPTDTISPQYAAQIYDALVLNNYVHRSGKTSVVEDAYFVNAEKWSALKNGADVVLTNYAEGKPLTPALNAAQLSLLKEVLIRAGIMQFPDYVERSPYLLNLAFGTAGKQQKLTLSIIHTPGPAKTKSNAGDAMQSYTTLLPSIANMSQCEEYHNAQHLLMMGDFNVSVTLEGRAVYQGYTIKETDNGGNKTWAYATSKKTTSNSFFSVFTANTFGATDLLGNTVKTSLTSALTVSKMGAMKIKDLTYYTDKEYMANPYDKFFFKSQGDTIAHNDTGKCLDMISAMNYLLSPSPIYKPREAACAVQFLKSRMYLVDKNHVDNLFSLSKRKFVAEHAVNEAKVQKIKLEAGKSEGSKIYGKRVENAVNSLDLTDQELKDLENEIDSLKNIITNIEAQTYIVPTDAATAYATYRIISDHLPIIVDLTIAD